MYNTYILFELHTTYQVFFSRWYISTILELTVSLSWCLTDNIHGSEVLVTMSTWHGVPPPCLKSKKESCMTSSSTWTTTVLSLLKLICINCNNSLYKYFDKLPTIRHSVISVNYAQFLYMSSYSQARSTRWLSSRCPVGPLRVFAPLLLPSWQSLSRCWWYRGGLETNPLWSMAGEPAFLFHV